ncbi:MAG: PIG-L family deacetylase [Bacteroidota bacterium]
MNKIRLFPDMPGKSTKLSFALLCSFLYVSLSFGQSRSIYSSDEISLAMEKSGVLGSVLYVAAHPDDENTRLLSFMARERNYRTGYLSITRGDGGQNLIGKEQGDLLGLIRTQELLAARRTDGAEQFFTRACDFGYSKNPEETFRTWNKDSVLSDVVWVIRNFRPDVIICRFPTTGEGGHGHHTASAILAQEAFTAAADPSRFSWQLAHVETWQARRLFWNTFNFGSTNTTSPDQLKLDVGVFNPLLGKSHGEIAAESRSNHKSQGFGSAAIRGSSIEYFKQLNGDSVKTDVFEGINTSWSRIAGASTLNSEIIRLKREFDKQHPWNSVQAILTIRKSLLSLDTTDGTTRYWRKIKLEENTRLLLACSGFWMEAYSGEPVNVPGTNCKLKIQAVNRGELGIDFMNLRFPDIDTAVGLLLKKNELITINHDFRIPEKTAWTSPYWLIDEHPSGIFNISDILQTGQAENDPAFHLTTTLKIGGELISMKIPVLYKYTDPVRGEVYRQVEILPPVTITFNERKASFFNKKPRTVTVTLRSNMDSLSGRLSSVIEHDWKVNLSDTLIRFEKKGEEIRLKMTVFPGETPDSKLSLSFNDGKISSRRGIKRIKYDHIPEQFFLPESSIPLKDISIKSSQGKVGYLEGAGDDVASCIEQAGYQVTILDEEALQTDDLSVFDAIVTGVRAFNTEQNLIRFRYTLLDYVKNGGNLIVQYNTNNRLGPAPE